MKSYLKLFLIACLLILSKANAQSLWEMEVNSYLIVGVRGDTTIANLYNILQADSLKNTIEFTCAAELLGIYEGQIAKDFILERIDHWRDKNDQFFNWNNYFVYQRIKGYLGESSAILGMDSVVMYSNNPALQINAISYLVEAGQLNHFELVKEIFNNQQETDIGISLLGKYGQDPRFREEAIDLLSGVVRDSSNYYKVVSAARELAELDKDYVVELLEQRFYQSEGFTRYNFLIELDMLDPKNQRERSIWAIPREPDDNFRSDYIPYLFEGDSELALRGYLTPRWINFIKSWLNVETNEVALFHIHSSLEDFQPAQPDSATPLSDIIDSLKILIDTVKSYAWLGDLQFKNELQNVLQTAITSLLNGDSLACREYVKTFQDSVDFVYKDSLNTDPRFVTIEGWKFLYWNAQYILDRLPEISTESEISTYSIFGTHGVWLEQNSEIISGNIGVNEIGQPPFMDSHVEMSIGISTITPAGSSIKANRIKVKQGATVNSNVYYNELENNGTITGTLSTPLELPLFAAVPEFKTSTPGTQNITVAQNGVQTLQPGSYNNIDMKRYGKLIFTGGEYHINKLTAGDDNQLLFQSESEVRIKDKFDSGQGTYIGPDDTTTLSADEIVFYVEGINGTNGNLGATPKAAKIGISNIVKANFYVPNGTLWIRQNSVVEGSFIGKDVDVGIGVKVKLNSAF